MNDEEENVASEEVIPVAVVMTTPSGEQLTIASDQSPTYNKPPSEVETLAERLDSIEESIRELTRAFANLKAGEHLPLNAYKVDRYVQILPPNYINWEDGRVLEVQKTFIIVSTARGEFSIGNPKNIRKQEGN